MAGQFFAVGWKFSHLQKCIRKVQGNGHARELRTLYGEIFWCRATWLNTTRTSIAEDCLGMLAVGASSPGTWLARAKESAEAKRTSPGGQRGSHSHHTLLR